MTTYEKCPVCSGPPGNFRFGTCSPGCEVVTGQPEDPVAFVAAILFLLMVLGTLAFSVAAVSGWV